jgi:hypothetical protein
VQAALSGHARHRALDAADYLRMRVLGDPDSFLASDLGVRRGLERLGAAATPAPRPTGPRRGDRGGRTRSCTSGRSRCGRPPTGRTPLTTFTTTIDSPVGPLVLTSDGTALTVSSSTQTSTRPGRPGGAPSWTRQPPSWASTSPASGPSSTCRSSGRHAVPAQHLAGPARDPLRRDHQLRPARVAGREPEGIPRRSAWPNGRNPISIVVPCHPGDRRRRLAHRVRRRAGPQAAAARPRAPGGWCEDPQLSLL